jgi:hypothetical protein
MTANRKPQLWEETVTHDELRQHKQTHDKQNSWWLNDAKGIPVSRVCDHCIRAVKAQYEPAVFGEGDDH